MPGKKKKEKPKKLANQCLLLKTPDNRVFFTEEKHFPCLIEFGRTFDAEISVVKTKEQVEVLDLSELAKCICTPLPGPTPEYEVIQIKMSPPQKKNNIARRQRSLRGRKIIDFIQERMIAGEEMSIKVLASHFADVPLVSLSPRFTRARRELVAKGHTVVKVRRGVYKLNQPA